MQPQDRASETERLLGQFVIVLSGHDALLEGLFVRLTALGHEMASTIYLASESTARRRQLIDSVAKIRLRDNASALAEWEAIRNEHNALFERRNRLLHDVWSVDPTNGTHMLVRQYPPNRPYKIDSFLKGVEHHELEALTLRASELARRMLKFSIELPAE